MTAVESVATPQKSDTSRNAELPKPTDFAPSKSNSASTTGKGLIPGLKMTGLETKGGSGPIKRPPPSSSGSSSYSSASSEESTPAFAVSGKSLAIKWTLNKPSTSSESGSDSVSDSSESENTPKPTFVGAGRTLIPGLRMVGIETKSGSDPVKRPSQSSSGSCSGESTAELATPTFAGSGKSSIPAPKIQAPSSGSGTSASSSSEESTPSYRGLAGRGLIPGLKMIGVETKGGQAPIKRIPKPEFDSTSTSTSSSSEDDTPNPQFAGAITRLPNSANPPSSSGSESASKSSDPSEQGPAGSGFEKSLIPGLKMAHVATKGGSAPSKRPLTKTETPSSSTSGSESSKDEVQKPIFGGLARSAIPGLKMVGIDIKGGLGPIKRPPKESKSSTSTSGSSDSSTSEEPPPPAFSGSTGQNPTPGLKMLGVETKGGSFPIKLLPIKVSEEPSDNSESSSKSEKETPLFADSGRKLIPGLKMAGIELKGGAAPIKRPPLTLTSSTKSSESDSSSESGSGSGTVSGTDSGTGSSSKCSSESSSCNTPTFAGATGRMLIPGLKMDGVETKGRVLPKRIYSESSGSSCTSSESTSSSIEEKPLFGGVAGRRFIPGLKMTGVETKGPVYHKSSSGSSSISSAEDEQPKFAGEAGRKLIPILNMVAIETTDAKSETVVAEPRQSPKGLMTGSPPKSPVTRRFVPGLLNFTPSLSPNN